MRAPTPLRFFAGKSSVISFYRLALESGANVWRNTITRDRCQKRFASHRKWIMTPARIAYRASVRPSVSLSVSLPISPFIQAVGVKSASLSRSPPWRLKRARMAAWEQFTVFRVWQQQQQQRRRFKLQVGLWHGHKYRLWFECLSSCVGHLETPYWSYIAQLMFDYVVYTHARQLHTTLAYASVSNRRRFHFNARESHMNSMFYSINLPISQNELNVYQRQS